VNDAVGEHQAGAGRGVGVVIRCAAAGLAACVMLVCGGAGAGVAAVVGPAHAWVTDGDVFAIASAGGSTYVGGDFRLIGRSTGSWAEVDSAGAVGAIRAVVRGSVADAVADGRGGWFLRGDISAVGGVDVGKTEVVHLRANGRLDPDWSIRTDGDIHTMARAGDRLYVGGSFTRLDGMPRRSLGAIHARSGALLDWGPKVAGRTRNDVGVVDTIAATSDGSVLFIGGDFGRVDGALRKSLAAIGADGALRPFDAGAGYASSGEETKDEEELSASVSLVELDPLGRALYVAGDFEMLGGAERPGLGAVDARTGRVRPWNPDCDGDVWATPDGTQLVVAGDFERIGGGRRDVASFELASGYVTDWRPVAPFSGLALAFGDAGTVFVAGEGAIAVFRWPPLL